MGKTRATDPDERKVGDPEADLARPEVARDGDGEVLERGHAGDGELRVVRTAVDDGAEHLGDVARVAGPGAGPEADRDRDLL